MYVYLLNILLATVPTYTIAIEYYNDKFLQPCIKVRTLTLASYNYNEALMKEYASLTDQLEHAIYVTLNAFLNVSSEITLISAIVHTRSNVLLSEKFLPSCMIILAIAAVVTPISPCTCPKHDIVLSDFNARL